MPYVGLTKLLQPFQQFSLLLLVRSVAASTANALIDAKEFHQKASKQRMRRLPALAWWACGGSS